jgi:hypothetical protein
MKEYFLDDTLYTESSGISKVPGKVSKKRCIITNDNPGDLSIVSAFCSSTVPLSNGSLRLYYSTMDIAGANSRYFISVAHSKDTEKWTKPDLGQDLVDGKNTNRLAITGIPEGCFALLPSVIKLSENNWRMFCWVHGKGFCRYVMCESTDGLNWAVVNLDRPCVYHPNDKAQKGSSFAGLTELKEQSERIVDDRAVSLKSNDATMTYYDDEKQIYRMYSVWLFKNYPEAGHYIEYDNTPNAYRVIQYRESRNGLNWGESRIIIVPDSDDSPDVQLYYLGAQKAAGAYVGQLGFYPVAEQTMDIELVFSNDGINWNRPLRNKFLIKRNREPGKEGMVTASHSMLKHGDSHLVFYTSYLNLHNMLKGPIGSSIMLAKLKGERFLGLQTGKEGGSITTKPLVLNSQEIFIDADIRGCLKAELCDPFGKVVDGFDFGHSIEVHGDSLKHRLSWHNEITDEMRYQAYRLKITWQDGEVYGIEY